MDNRQAIPVDTRKPIPVEPMQVDKPTDTDELAHLAFLPILDDEILVNVAEGYMSVENAVIYVMDGLHIFSKEVMKIVYESISTYHQLPNVTTHLKRYISDRTNNYQLYLTWPRKITEYFPETKLHYKPCLKSTEKELAEFLYDKIQQQSKENFDKLYAILKKNEEIEELLKYHISAGYKPNGTEIPNSFDAFQVTKETSKKNVDLKVRLIPYINRQQFPDLQSRKNQYGNVDEDDDHNLKDFKAKYKNMCDYYKNNPDERTDKYGNENALVETKTEKDVEGNDVSVVVWHPKFISVDIEHCAYYHPDKKKYNCHYIGFGLDKTRVFIIEKPTEQTLHEIYYNIFHPNVHLMEWGGTTDSDGKRRTQVSENLQSHPYVFQMKLGKAMEKLTGKKRDKGRTFAPWSFDTKYLKNEKLMSNYLARDCVDMFYAKELLYEKNRLPESSRAHIDEIFEDGEHDSEEEEYDGGYSTEYY